MSSSPTSRPHVRALRIGVVLGDTLVSEHVVHSGTAFTIGQSIRNLVPLPVAGLPRRWQLVELVERGVLLRLAPGMGARVSVEGHVLGRADLDARGAHTRAATLVTLPPGTHGKIDLGEVRVLFQELRMPAPAPRPQLPRAVKGTLGDRIDRRMTVFAAASLLVHFGIMTAAHLNDPPEDSTIAERALAQYTPETISIIDADDPILDLDREPTTTPDQDPAVASTTTPAKPVVDREPRPSRPRPAQPVHTDSRDLAGDATRMADLLFADSGGGKVDAGDMAPRKPGHDLDKQLQELNDANAKVSIGNEQGDRLRDHGPRQGTIEEPPVVGDPRITKADGDKVDKVPPARIDVIPQPPKKPGVDTEAIVNKIRTTYMSAMQRCYKKALADDPTLTGKVTLLFTLSEKGGVSDPEARGVSKVFEECITGVMPRWTFTPVTDEDGDPLELDIGVTLQLSI
jgi:hypothetical protein